MKAIAGNEIEIKEGSKLRIKDKERDFEIIIIIIKRIEMVTKIMTGVSKEKLKNGKKRLK